MTTLFVASASIPHYIKLLPPGMEYSQNGPYSLLTLVIRFISFGIVPVVDQ